MSHDLSLLLAVIVVGTAIPLAITALDLWHLHARMDTVAHFASGAALAAAGIVVFGDVRAAVVVTVALAIAWEWLEPRLPWDLVTPSQDTEADIAVAGFAAALVALAWTHA